MKNPVRLRAIWLTVNEVDNAVEAITNALAASHLNSQQRHHLEEARQGLQQARDGTSNTFVEVPEVTVAKALRCIASTQAWFEDMMSEFGDDHS